MNYRIIPVTAFAQNCSLIWCGQTRLAALVDPGGDAERIKAVVAEAGVTLMQILLTHGHLDHVGAAAELAQHYGVPVIGPEKEDEFWLEGLPAQSRMFGLEDCQPLRPDRWLNEGDVVNVGNVALQVLHCPGHTPGHVVFTPFNINRSAQAAAVVALGDQQHVNDSIVGADHRLHLTEGAVYSLLIRGDQSAGADALVVQAKVFRVGAGDQQLFM